MKHFKSVVAFGDSHVAGNELSNRFDTLAKDYIRGKISLETLDEPGKKLSFPKIIADKLNVPCYNYALSGGSNDRSLRLLTEVIEHHPDSLVLFGYTSTDRKELYFPDKGLFLGRDKDNFLQVGVHWQDVKLSNPINDSYLYILRPYNNLKQLMFTVDSICKRLALDFYHIPLFPEEIPQIDNVITFEGFKNYFNWCEAKKFTKLPGRHYSQEAHNATARLILKEIVTNRLNSKH